MIPSGYDSCGCTPSVVGAGSTLRLRQPLGGRQGDRGVRLIVVAHGGASRGVGHMMRSLALVQEAQSRNWSVTLAGEIDEGARGLLASLPPDVKVAVTSGMDDIEAVTTGADIVHVDTYDSEFDHFRVPGALMSTMADASFGLRESDVLVDTNPGALARLSQIEKSSGAVVLAGPDYCPIRQEVRHRRRSWRAPASDRRKVLVVVGGSDPSNLTLPAVAAIASTGLPVALTIIAPREQHEALADFCRTAGIDPRLLTATPELPSLASDQDLVVTAAGTSIWEFACMGLPMALICAVENQRDNYESMVGAGAAVGISPSCGVVSGGAHFDEAIRNPEFLQKFASTAASFVDGEGAWRVVSTWEQARTMETKAEPARPEMRARRVTSSDSRMLFEWRNDPVTRRRSRNTEPITWESHQSWLAHTISSSGRLLLLVECEGKPTATVRFDRIETEGRHEGYEVSITLAPESRGLGLAAESLRSSEAAILLETPGSVRLFATIHEDNPASYRLFARARYTPFRPVSNDGFLMLSKVISPAEF